MILPYDQGLKTNARKLRGDMTDAEQKLWNRLRRKQINGWQFYRQKPLGPYIVDFYCAAAGLVVELDGSQHFEAEHQAADQRRDAYLQNLGLRVLRFDNRQVLLELDAVVEVISRIPPGPPFSKGGDNCGPGASDSPDENDGATPDSALPIPTLGKDVATPDQFNSILSFENGRDKPDHSNLIPPFEKGGLGGIHTNNTDNGKEPS
ncbi:hypothetical protein [Methylomonas albis]|uniref:endonuclease domain-containing protein n=1 Tax=Methylomonas albis TaxID=1854563 RepID=UPI0019F93B93|nr:endonuclease domain-containing protein [Methylomonas albis]CAD6878182.1 hypothetical protein [Methylomonas albis]